MARLTETKMLNQEECLLTGFHVIDIYYAILKMINYCGPQLIIDFIW